MVQALICHWHCKLNPHCFKRPVKFDLSVPVQLKQRRPPKFKLNFPACLSHLPPFFPVKWTLSCNNSDLSHWDADTITQILLCPFEMPWQGHWFRNTSTVNLYIWTQRFCEVFLFAFSIRGKSELLDKNSWESLRGGHKKADRKTMSLADEAERGWICSRDEWEVCDCQGAVDLCDSCRQRCAWLYSFVGVHVRLKTQSLGWRRPKGDGVTVTGSHISTAGREKHIRRRWWREY